MTFKIEGTTNNFWMGVKIRGNNKPRQNNTSLRIRIIYQNGYAK